MKRIPVEVLRAVPCGVTRRWVILTKLSCILGLLWIMPVDAGANPNVAPPVAHSRGDSVCTLPGAESDALVGLRALSVQLGSIRLPGLVRDPISQLWMGVPITMRAFALPINDAAGNKSVATRLAHAQPLLHDLAITNDGFVLVGRDEDTQWAAHWQVRDGWARGWLSAFALRLPGKTPEVHTQFRTVVMSWLPIDARMIAHYVHDLEGDAPQMQGVWQITQPPIQAARIVTNGLVRDGWVAQSSIDGQWQRGPCLLDFLVLDSLAVDGGADVSATAHSFLWALLRRTRK